MDSQGVQKPVTTVLETAVVLSGVVVLNTGFLHYMD
jgi:hypothetical protein